MTAYDDLMAFQRQTEALAQVAGRLGWDQETVMPEGAAAGWSGALHHATAGAAPSLLTLALPFSWQEAFVPAALFGGLTGLAFWHLNRPKGARPPDAGDR